jgi:hypothetical protein
MKYKICKYKNGLGEEWYQIKIKWWIFWYNYESPNYGNYNYSIWMFTGDRFETPESAQATINLLINNDKRYKIQLISCEEIK